MRITESKLRSIIRQVIKEADDRYRDFPHYNKGYLAGGPNSAWGYSDKNAIIDSEFSVENGYSIDGFTDYGDEAIKQFGEKTDYAVKTKEDGSLDFDEDGFYTVIDQNFENVAKIDQATYDKLKSNVD